MTNRSTDTMSGDCTALPGVLETCMGAVHGGL
jgi:hypothetical protein